MKRKEYTQQDIQLIKELYSNNIKVADIARQLKTANTRITQVLTELGIKRTKAESMRINKGIKQVRSDAFDVLTGEALYWIGFLYADGHIDRDRPRISITTTEADVEHLHKFNAFLGGELRVIEVDVKTKAKGQVNELGKYYRVAFSDTCIYEKLKSFGFTHNKTLNLAPNNLLKHSRDFWRGVVDGDGWVCRSGCKRNREGIGLSGTQDTLVGFIEFVNDNGIKCGSTPYKDSRKNVWKVNMHDFMAIRTCHLLYKDAPVYLDRKYKKYLSFID